MSKQDVSFFAKECQELPEERTVRSLRIALPVFLERVEKLAQELSAHAVTIQAEVTRDVGACLERLQSLAQAVRYQEAEWQTLRQQGNPEEFNAMREEAEALYRELMRVGKFAFEGDVEMRNRIAAIEEGDGLADLIQDLIEIAVSFRKQADFIREQVGPGRFELAMLDRAEALSQELSYFDKKAAKQDAQDALLLRDRLVSLLLEEAKEAQELGRFGLRKEASKAKPFRASLFSRKRKKKADEAEAPSTDADDEASSEVSAVEETP